MSDQPGRVVPESTQREGTAMLDQTECPTCEGVGGFPSGVPNVMGAAGEFYDLCETCSGTGRTVQTFVKCVICGAGMDTRHAATHIQAHRDSGWDGTD